ncbi:hypothetical protein L211DRAFT_497986 [Terfezia boudieri ATCC MYA-4762]|uniref:Uncharacterized protein n=1 Tax=Terfezia boudieri ATCC MYA-4762 TaxID=1051890 RepID=A0A3N4LRR4_9PEZI|nr:hypothetical protein L211DRAFT_497986 [Terfezia boudieri ATCC MYA-4762]
MPTSPTPRTPIRLVNENKRREVSPTTGAYLCGCRDAGETYGAITESRVALYKPSTLPARISNPFSRSCVPSFMLLSSHYLLLYIGAVLADYLASLVNPPRISEWLIMVPSRESHKSNECLNIYIIQDHLLQPQSAGGIHVIKARLWKTRYDPID